jgi:hypothetical protein
MYNHFGRNEKRMEELYQENLKKEMLQALEASMRTKKLNKSIVNRSKSAKVKERVDVNKLYINIDESGSGIKPNYVHQTKV